MPANYPQKYSLTEHMSMRSAHKTRAFLSMAAACVELKGLNPRLVITTDVSEHDAYYIKYKNPTYEEAHLANASPVYIRLPKCIHSPGTPDETICSSMQIS